MLNLAERTTQAGAPGRQGFSNFLADRDLLVYGLADSQDQRTIRKWRLGEGASPVARLARLVAHSTYVNRFMIEDRPHGSRSLWLGARKSLADVYAAGQIGLVAIMQAAGSCRPNGSSRASTLSGRTSEASREFETFCGGGRLRYPTHPRLKRRVGGRERARAPLEELYLVRGADVSRSRPIATGDVFKDIVIPGVECRAQSSVCSHMFHAPRRPPSHSHVQMGSVGQALRSSAHWDGNYGVMPLPELRGSR